MPPADDPSVDLLVTADPSRALLARVDDLLARAADADGAPPLNEAALLALAHPHRGGVRHLVATAGSGPDEAPLGYAQLAADGTGQLVVDPSHRRRGVGRRLVETLLHAATEKDGRLRVWALGDTPAAQALAARTGLVATRVLLQMRRRLDDLPEPEVPKGFVLAPFRVGLDEQAWLEVNARAFAHHPEQGAIDSEDLAERIGEDWFDPAGFFLARRVDSTDSTDRPEPRVLGFHWTKRHGGGLGEVYVLGVDPDAQGHGLGQALLLTGLTYLHEVGDDAVELYVEQAETGPVRLYEKYGFVEVGRDKMYAGPPGPA